MADIMTADGVNLLDRLDFLRGFLRAIDGIEDLSSFDWRIISDEDIGAHLATIDDACEALQQ